jgi:CheY-like chemotaxis protein
MARILLIEDDPCVQFALEKLLELSGYEVQVASNGEDALAQLQQGNGFNVVLCDIEMPVQDGFHCLECASKLHGDGPPPPFIFMSAYVDQHVIERVEQTSAFCVLKKPIGHDILRSLFLALEIE